MSQKFKWRSITPGSSLWTNVEMSRFDKFKESMNNILSSHQRAKYVSDEPPQENFFDGKKKKKKMFMFPHWMIYIAWFSKYIISVRWGSEWSDL